MDFETRRADPSDADDIAAAHVDSIHSIGASFYPAEVVNAWGAPRNGDPYVRAMKRGETFFIAIGRAEHSRGILGFSSHHVMVAEHRTAIYVRGSASRRGIGSALFRLAEAEAIAANAISIRVDASLAAVEFYLANGFHEVGHGQHRLRSGVSMACVFMEKTLKTVRSVGV
jgi:putative acetyltransferase